MSRKPQPVDRVEWVDRESLRENDYNPNAQAPPEHRLLKTSILEDGWTQPIVVHRPTMTIVDGAHRWRASADPAVYALTGGLVPVVYLDGDRPALQAATIRHNRARGVHGIRPMAAIVRGLVDAGLSRGQVAAALGMEDEEVSRLLDRAGQPERIGSRKRSGFSKAWQPDR